MASVTYKTTVAANGGLSIPEGARESLGLRPGDEVEVSLRVSDAPSYDQGNNPLHGIVGIGKGGPVDGAENHDAYLYSKR